MKPLFKSSIIILLSLSLIANTIQLINSFRLKNNLKASNINSTKTMEVMDNLLETQKAQFKFIGTYLFGYQNIIDSLKHAVKDGPKLLFIFSESACETCVDKAISDLITVGKTLGNRKILFLTNFSNTRQVLYLQKRLDDAFRIYNLPPDTLITSSNALFEKTPSFSIVDKNLNLNHFYIYSIAFPELNGCYFNSVVRILTGIGN